MFRFWLLCFRTYGLSVPLSSIWFFEIEHRQTALFCWIAPWASPLSEVLPGNYTDDEFTETRLVLWLYLFLYSYNCRFLRFM